MKNSVHEKYPYHIRTTASIMNMVVKIMFAANKNDKTIIIMEIISFKITEWTILFI